MLRAHLNLSDSLELLGRHQEAAEAAERGLRLAARIGLARHIYGMLLIVNRVEALMHLGRWSEADRLLSDAVDEVGSLTSSDVLHVQRAGLAARTGRYRSAVDELEAAGRIPGMGSEQSVMLVARARAELALAQGNLEAARCYVQSALDTDMHPAA